MGFSMDQTIEKMGRIKYGVFVLLSDILSANFFVVVSPYSLILY